jgi:hypothetical protein
MTLANMREHGVRSVDATCEDYLHVEMEGHLRLPPHWNGGATYLSGGRFETLRQGSR